MKNLIILLFALSLIAKAQDLEPVQHQFMYDGTLRYLSPDSYPFNQTSYLLGWHWGGKKSMTSALKMNQVHSATCYWSNNKWNSKDTSEFANNLNMIVLTHDLWSIGNGITPLQSLSMQYEPTMSIPSPYSHTVRSDDPTNSIFGFQYVRGRILSNPSDNNYNRLILTTDSLTNWQDSIVLKNAWMNNQFYLIADDPATTYDDDYNTYNMFLTINLRRITGTLGNNDTILSIRLPYSTYPRYMVIRNQNGDSIGVKTDSIRRGYIKFKDVPDYVNPQGEELANGITTAP